MDLFKFLEKAKLDSYHDSFVEMGGDDLGHLLEADEGEVDEILRLVGMDSKPIHVMSFKRALKELRGGPGEGSRRDLPGVSSPIPTICKQYF